MMNIAVSSMVPVRSDTFFGSVHTSLVDMTYHKLSQMAYRRHLKTKFEKLTKNIDFREIERRLLQLKNELPDRISAYHLDIYANEILLITFGTIEQDENIKKIMEEITTNASTEEIMELTLNKWDTVEMRIKTYINEAIKTLLEGEHTEQEAYYLITYIQGLAIMDKITSRIKRVLLKKRLNSYRDFSDALEMISRFLLLSLITARYIDGELKPEDYIYSMEYVSEVFVGEPGDEEITVEDPVIS